MTLIPDRTVSSQLASQLRNEIARGTWRGWLPGERELSHLLQASRNSVRRAIQQLENEGLIQPLQGVGNRIAVAPPSIDPNQPKTVGILIPQPFGHLRPAVALWIDELKDLLLAKGFRLRVHEGAQYYKANPNASLERLVNQNAHDAWILTLSSHAMQRWFARSQVPCLVAGSTFPGIALRHFDLDHRSTCRNAAGVLLRQGHRRLALLNRESRRAGDLESELGFLEGIRSFMASDAVASVEYHRDDVETVRRALGRLFESKTPPTGILVNNSYAYVATASLLAQRRLRIPQDVSLISRDDDPFLDALAPSPARYKVSPHVFAKRMIGSILRLIDKDISLVSQPQLLPKYQPGQSVGPVSKQG